MSSSHHSISRTQRRFSRDGFAPLPTQDDNMPQQKSKDATIDIPLEHVATHSKGLRSEDSRTALNPAVARAISGGSRKKLFRGRRRKAEAINAGGTKRIGSDGEEDTITTMGKIYNKIRDFSIVTRYFVYVLPLALIIAVPVIVGATVAKDAELGGVRIVWFFTWVEILWLSLWVSKIVAHYLPLVFQTLAGVVSSGVRKYSMVIRSLEIPLSLVGWTVASLATFVPLMTKNPDNSARCAKRTNPDDPAFVEDYSCFKDWERVVQKILAAALVASLIWLAEKTLIQLISINYHRKQFNARIKDSKRQIHTLGILYDASRALFPAYCDEFAEEDHMIADALGLSGSKDSRRTGSGSATPMRVLASAARFKNNIASAFGNVAQEITGRNVFNSDAAHSIVIEALEKTRTSEALAKRIWLSFVVEGRDTLYEDDLIDVLGETQQELAEEAFEALDGDGNGDISLDEMILTVTEMGRERKAISTSMSDVDAAIRVLDNVLSTVALIIITLVFVGFLNKNFVSTLATTGTALLSLSFVFASTAAEVLGSCIFLFVKHPFDVGDRVDLKGDRFVVEHISLLYTVFRHVDGANTGQLCQFPNILLNLSYPVENVTRSKSMSEQLHIDVSFDTSFDDVQILKRELLAFVTDKENSRDFQSMVEIDILGTSDQSNLTLLVEMKIKGNSANEALRRSRRSKFMCALISALKAVPIYAPGGGGDAQGSAAAPNYNVAITETEAKEHKDVADKDREEARLVPTKKDDEDKKDHLGPGAGLTPHQFKVVDNLTGRNPASDPVRDDMWASNREDGSPFGDAKHVDPTPELDEVRGTLRRESTRGKRKASEKYHPSIPGINEPSQRHQAYPREGFSLPPQPATGYENQQPSYQPTYRPSPTTHHLDLLQGAAATRAAEMSQVQQPQHRESNPYRQRSESIDRKPVLPPPAPPKDTDQDDEEWRGRPYSGV